MQRVGEKVALKSFHGTFLSTKCAPLRSCAPFRLGCARRDLIFNEKISVPFKALKSVALRVSSRIIFTVHGLDARWRAPEA